MSAAQTEGMIGALETTQPIIAASLDEGAVNGFTKTFSGADFMASDYVEVRYPLTIVEESNIGLGDQFYEEDAFDVEAALRPEVREWFLENTKGYVGGIGWKSSYDITLHFEHSTDAVAFALRWQ